MARPKTPANSPGTRERAVAIENILCRYSTSSSGLSIAEILELLETEYDIVATERSVREQLKTLVAMSDEGKLMRTISRQQSEGRRVRWIADQIFSEAELRLIADGLTMARLKNEDLLSIIKKLQELAGDANGRTISHVKRYGQERGMVAHVSLSTITSLIDAIAQRRVVRVAYTHRETDGSLAPNLDDKGAEKSYLLEPYQLAFKNSHYYLICRPHDGALADGHPWYLRVDHIADVRATRRRFDAPASNVELGGDHFDAVSHMDEMAYPLGGRVEHVRVRTTLLDAIYDWYPTASVRRVGTGDAQEPVYEAEFDTVLLPTCWWALQYAEYVEVLGPQALRDMIAQSVRTLERTYDIEPEARPREAHHGDPRQNDQRRPKPAPRNHKREGTRMRIYAMSDIHGCLGDLERRLAHLRKLGFFDDACEDQLVLIGDFIDRGPDGLGVVRRVMALEDECPGRVRPLMGNHEAEMLEWVGMAPAEKSDAALEGDLTDDERALLGEVLAEGSDDEALARLRMWQGADKGALSMRSFAGAAALADIEAAVAAHDDALAAAAFERACEMIRSDYAAELRWMGRLAPYLKTARHVFVHSGIDESQGAEWELATPLERMLAGRETPTGAFVLDVVCGHTPAAMVAEKVTGDGSVEGVWWDGASHFYVDGATAYTHRLPTLVCDEACGRHLELDECGRPREIASAARR